MMKIIHYERLPVHVILTSLMFLLSFGQEICRTSNGTMESLAEFSSTSCLRCYENILGTSAEDFFLNVTYFKAVPYPDIMQDKIILSSLGKVETQDAWKRCCRSATSCCLNQSVSYETLGCPRTWDGLLCWEQTLAGHTSRQLCPGFMICPEREALKECVSSGNWYRNENNFEWTNYRSCSPVPPERPISLALIAYIISLLTLIPAIFIFQIFSSLKCFRVVLLKNLMLSLILHCTCEISFLGAFLLPAIQPTFDGDTTIKENGSLCRFLRAASIYLTVSNYMWMLCQGLLLYRQLVNTFKPEAKKWMFFFIGWGIPCLPLVVSVAYRLSSDDSNCWAYPSGVDWVWKIPCLLSLLINCVFFIYILTVFVRIHSRQNSDNILQFKKALRAGLVLVPLFGLHSVLMMYRPLKVCTLAEEYYSYSLRLIEGLQGCIVAVTYCYVNSEVREALRRTYRNLVDQQQLGQGQVNYTSAISTQTVL